MYDDGYECVKINNAIREQTTNNFNTELIIIIIMLRRVIKPALSLLSLVPKRVALCTMRPAFTFANEVQSSSNFAKTIQEEIDHEEKNKEDLSEFVNFFQNQGWKIKYEGVQIELAKKQKNYNLRLLFNARTPMGEDPQEEGQAAENQEAPEDDQDYCEITAYINKDGTSKWMAIDFFVGNNQTQMTSAAFIQDYETEKAERKKGRVLAGGYAGPELSSLEEGLQNSLYEMIEAVGITGQALQRASQLSVAYEHQFYLEWLKDLKSLA